MSIRNFFKFDKKKQPAKEVEKSITYLRYPTEEEFVSDSYQDSFQQNHNQTLLWLFQNIPEVNSIITYIATLCADVKLTHVKVLANFHWQPLIIPLILISHSM